MAGLDKSYFLDGKPSTMVEVNQAWRDIWACRSLEFVFVP